MLGRGFESLGQIWKRPENAGNEASNSRHWIRAKGRYVQSLKCRMNRSVLPRGRGSTWLGKVS